MVSSESFWTSILLLLSTQYGRLLYWYNSISLITLIIIRWLLGVYKIIEAISIYVVIEIQYKEISGYLIVLRVKRNCCLRRIQHGKLEQGNNDVQFQV